FKEKLPLPWVVVPFEDLFFSLMLTPGIGTCRASVTVPFTVCWIAATGCFSFNDLPVTAMEGLAARLQSSISPALAGKGTRFFSRLLNRFCKYISNCVVH